MLTREMAMELDVVGFAGELRGLADAIMQIHSDPQMSALLKGEKLAKTINTAYGN
jgi:hypothetical protein